MFGIPEIDISGLEKLKSEGKIKLIDVRSEGEVARGCIEGAEHIPMHLIPLKANEFCAETPTVFYCQSGARSGQVTAFMSQQGFSNVMNLQGGILAWMRSGQMLSSPV
ncbi:MAG: rhodanese-like domain-containing protein [Sulfuricella sp.]|jgi:rhodanese-related sulfurtransferase